MTEITMPRLSDSMEEGTILSWLKRDGDHVERGEELVEIETDKATMSYESPEAGIVQILAPEGGAVAVGEPIARVAAATDVAATEPAARAPSPAKAHVRTPSKSASSSPRSDFDDLGANGTSETAVAIRATPLARRVAADHDVDLGAVAGTGPHGRVTRADVAAAASLSSPSPVPAGARQAGGVTEPPSVPSAPPVSTDSGAATSAKGVKTVQRLTRIQQVIARRMAETKGIVPDFQVQAEAEMDALLALRAQLKAAVDLPPSVNDFIIKAVALALREFALVNGSYTDGGFEIHSRVNVGVAVAAEGALIVPTVTDADIRSLGAIASEVRRLARAVRDGTITSAELAGATFTVSNLGMYEMTAITPMINPPQAAILGVGAARRVLHRRDAAIVERQLMTLTLSCDHRIVYGAEASRFLSRIRELLEQPFRLAFGGDGAMPDRVQFEKIRRRLYFAGRAGRPSDSLCVLPWATGSGVNESVFRCIQSPGMKPTAPEQGIAAASRAPTALEGELCD